MKSTVIQEIKKDKRYIKKENFENLFKLAIDYQISTLFGKKSFRLKEHIDYILDLIIDQNEENYLKYIQENMLTVENPEKYLMAVQLILSSVERYFWFWIEDHFPNDLVRDLMELSECFNSFRDRIAFSRFRNEIKLSKDEQVESEKLVEDGRFFLYKRTREIKDYYESIIESTTDAIISTDEKGRIILFNNGASRMLKYRPEEVFHKNVDFLYTSPEDTEELKGKLIDGKGLVHAFETAVKTKNGEEIPVLISASIIRNKLGNTVGIVRYIKDISALKDLEKELRRLSNFKTNYIAAMSHEIKTPVASIIGFVDIILGYYENVLDVNVKKYLDKIKNSGEVLLDLLSTLIDISKIDAGKIELTYSNFDPTELLEDVKVIFLPKMAEKSLDFSTSAESNLREIVADRSRLRQVIFNLVDNAHKFTPKGGKITLVLSSDKNNFIISVIDTGIGIKGKDKGRIFLSFEQGESTDNTGSGLGLAISRKLIELHGGEIAVDSQSGQGSKFIVKIPLKPQTNPHSEQ